MRLSNIPAFQLLLTRSTTARFLKPAWLVLQYLFAADTALLNQEGAFWTLDIVRMALVLNLRVIARRSRSSAWKPTLRRLGTTLKSHVSHCQT